MLGPTHQNPALVPPIPIPVTPDDFGTSANNLGFQDGGFAESNLTRRQIDKPNTGALYCTDGPCVDDSCCGPDGICGYGPDFCDAGCTSNCDATAMCGEYSEDANMPCGMKLCCSATGWCGSKSCPALPLGIRADCPYSNRKLLPQRGSTAWNFTLSSRIRLVCYYWQTIMCQG